MKVIVLGCGRSGTKYLAECARRLGVDFLHEKIGKNGGIGWNLPCAFPVAVDRCPLKLHQVRNAYTAIPSMMTHSRKVFERIGELVGTDFFSDFGEESDYDKLVVAARCWLHYSNWCADRAIMTYRAEDLRKREMPSSLFLHLWGSAKKWPQVSGTTNRRHHKKLDASDINGLPVLGPLIAEQNIRFGYEA